MSKQSPEQSYWQDVTDMADQVEEYAKENDWPDREAIFDYMHDSIDGCGRIIYTQNAKECLVFSRNDGAYVDQFGKEGVTDGQGNLNWSALAYAAFEADVFEELSSRGFDLNADRPGYVEPEEDHAIQKGA